eukprot:5456165-Pyramimonas_sp.AAC.1
MPALPASDWCRLVVKHHGTVSKKIHLRSGRSIGDMLVKGGACIWVLRVRLPSLAQEDPYNEVRLLYKRALISGVLSAPLRLLAQKDP